MFNLKQSILCLFLCLMSTSVMGQSQSSEKYEALRQEAIRLYKAGKIDNAHQKADAARSVRDFAASQGKAWALYKLGRKNSTGDDKDYSEAVRLYELAAKQGYAEAQQELGLLYENGYGVLQNLATAHMWYNVASANGSERAGRMRDVLAVRLSKKELSQAREMARRCKSSGYEDCTEQDKSILDIFR